MEKQLQPQVNNTEWQSTPPDIVAAALRDLEPSEQSMDEDFIDNFGIDSFVQNAISRGSSEASSYRYKPRDEAEAAAIREAIKALQGDAEDLFAA